MHSGKNLDLKRPNSDQEESSVVDAPLLVDKYFSQKRFGAGQILLRPGAEKGRQHVRRDTMVSRVELRCAFPKLLPSLEASNYLQQAC